MSSRAEWRPLGAPAAALLLGLLVLGASLALGGVFAYACGLLAVCAGVLACMAPLPTAPRQAARTLIGLGIGLGAYMLLTIVPLPLGLLERVAPAQAMVWARAMRPFGETVASGTISLEPIATKTEITKLLLYGCVFVVALGLAERRRGTSSLERVICAVTATVALVSLAHWAMGQTTVLGIYEPELARNPRHVSVFLNPNHLSEVMAIGAAVATGVLVSAKERARQVEAALTLAIATLCAAVAASRGGLVALAVGSAVALVGSRGRLDAGRARLVTLGAVVAGAIAVAVVAASEEIMTEAFSRDIEKADIFRQSLPLLFRYGLLGIGRGAFESVSSEARRDLGAYVFTHPENLLLQWSIEWGVLVTVVALVLIVRSLAPGVLRGRAVMPWGAYGGLLAFALQNQVDYGSEVPGVVLLALCCLALVAGGARATGTSKARPDRTLSPWVLAARALGVAALVGGGLTFLAADHELWVETRELSKAVRERDFPERLRDAIGRHPAEPHLAYLGALRAATVEHTTVLPWVTRVLERSPVHGRAHLLLARELEASFPAQARLEYRRAYVEDWRTHAAFVQGVGRLARDYDDAAEMVPRAVESVAALDVAGPRILHVPFGVRLGAIHAIANAIEPTLPATRDRLLRAHVAGAPAEQGSMLIQPLAAAAVDDVVNDAPWCIGQERACFEEARDATVRWLALAPTDVAPRVAAARLLSTTDPSRALAFLATSETEVDDVPDLLLSASELAERARLAPTATQLLDRAVDRCSGIEDCVRILARAVALEQRRGRPERALVLLRRKTALVPHEAAAWREQAVLAESLGLFTESSEAWNEVQLLTPGDPAAAEALRRLRVAQQKRNLPALPRAD